jgi:cathepsin L
MRTVAILAFALLIAAATGKKPLAHEVAAYTFEQYVTDFKKDYKAGSVEYDARRQTFESRKKAVLEHNGSPAKSANYKKGINHMSDRTESEFRKLLGGKVHQKWQEREQLRSTPFAKTYKATDSQLPESVDWRGHVPSIFTGVKDQGQCGSCWAHAATENLETHWALLTGELYTLSQQEVTACAPNTHDCGGTGGCGGSIAELAYKYWSTEGVVQEWAYPYTAFYGTTGTCAITGIPKVDVNVTGFTAVPSNNQDAVMHALAYAGPLAVNVDASGWSDYDGGIFDGCNYANNITIDHVVQLVGYGYDMGLQQSYWIIRNSWNPSWGEKGFIRLIRHEKASCGWDVDAQDGTACTGQPAQLWACGQCGILFDTLYPNVVQNA